MALYQDDFLSGFTLRDSASFDEWQFFETEGLRDELAGALERLVRHHSAQGERGYERAIGYARRRLALDPLHEPAHRELMQLYVQAGQRSAALRQYEECVRILKKELGLPPTQETTALYERIKAGPAGSERRFAAARPQHNLPAQSTPFVGRKDELAAIEARLSDPACRLLTLVGPGGSGKTRLALEAGASQLDSFEHGVFFVSLAPLRSVDAIVPTTANALDFPFFGGEEPQQQLLDYLHEKCLLIIMDNFEHLLEGTELVTDVLRTAQEVKILATSRARLNVGGEHRFQIRGMDVPDRDKWEDATDYSAVQLFLQGARRTRAGFEPSADNLKHISHVCRLVEGMPLAIRLAAAWVGMLSPEEIANQLSGEIGPSLDFLETDRRDVPDRQQSMRATFDHSWKLLTAREREVFQGLSVFRGGFTRKAAQEVTGASLRDLMALVDKSLVYRAPTGRYEIHELLRQYAEEKLDQEPAAGQAVHDRHCACYTAALQRWEVDLKGPRQQATLLEMDTEIENARAAWDWATERGQVERLDRAMEGLLLFYRRSSRYMEGEAACRVTVCELAATLSGDGPVLSADEMSVAKGLRAWAKVLTWQVLFNAMMGHFELARQLAQQSMVLLEQPALADQDTRAEKAFVLLWMGWVEYFSGPQDARPLFEQSLALYRALGDRWGMAEVLFPVGSMTYGLGSDGEGKQLLEECLAIRQSLGDQLGIAAVLRTLGLHIRAQGQLEEAERLCRESLAICQEMDNRGELATGLVDLGEVRFELGDFAEGYSMMKKGLAIFDDLGHNLLEVANLALGEAEAHLGQYEQARAIGQRGLAIHRESDWGWGIGFSCYVLGLAAVAQEAYAEAHQSLQKGVFALREIGHRENLGWALSVLGHAACGLGQLPQAQQHLYEALQTAAITGAFKPCVLALSAVALLLADRGEVERAVELYALAARYPIVANSRWFKDVAGEHIAAIAETLPPEVVAAAQERGRARDLDATVAELLVELEG